MPHNLCKRLTSPDPCKAWYYLPPAPALIPSPSPFPMTVGHHSSLWRGGMVAHPPDPNPPPQTLTVIWSHWMGDENCRGGGLDLLHSHPPSMDFSADCQCLGGGIRVRGWATTPPRHKLGGWPTVIKGEGWGRGRWVWEVKRHPL